MRVEFSQREDQYDANRASRLILESLFLGRILHEGHPTTTYRGAIDGIPISRSAGFPKMVGGTKYLLGIISSFVNLRFNLMNTLLSLQFEHNGDQPLSMGGSFFIRVQPEKDIFLEINFKEELDDLCDDPIKILGLTSPKDFELARILMVGQRKLTVGDDSLEEENCRILCSRLTFALQSMQNYYKWEDLDRIEAAQLELSVRASKLTTAMVKSFFVFEHGTLGPKLKQLAEQYLV